MPTAIYLGLVTKRWRDVVLVDFRYIIAEVDWDNVPRDLREVTGKIQKERKKAVVIFPLFTLH